MVGQQENGIITQLSNQAIQLIGDKDSFVFIKDQQHRYLGCNENYAQFLGLDDCTEIVGLTDHIIHPQHAELYRTDDDKVLSGEIININNPTFFKKIGTATVVGKIIPLTNDGNNVYGILGTTKLIFNLAAKPFCQAIALLNATTIPLIVSQKFYEINTKYGKVRISKRETECILFLFKCMTAEAIAICLQLSQRSVESYFVNIKNKLNVKHQSEIIEVVVTGGLLEQL